MRKIRIAVLATLGVIAFALPLLADTIQYGVDTMFMDDESNIVGEWAQNCYGNITSWGTQTEHASVMNYACQAQAVCDSADGYVWAEIDSSGPVCVSEHFMYSVCEGWTECHRCEHPNCL